ncbi:MAG: ATP-grasp domain-containing protein [Gilvibacter sp.]
MSKLLVIETDGKSQIGAACRAHGWKPIFVDTQSYDDWLPTWENQQQYDVRKIKEPSFYDLIKIIEEEQIKAVLPISLLEPEGVRDSLVKSYIDQRKLGVNIIANDPATMEATYDKWLTKQILKDHGVSVTPGHLIDTSKEAKEYSLAFDFPVIVKEKKSFTGMGIRILKDQKSYQNYISRNRDKALFVEPFVEGSEVSLEVISWKGDKLFQPLVYKGETRINILEHPAYRPRISPYKKGSMLEKQIVQMVSKAVDVLGLSGAAEFEFIIVNGQPMIMEINPRVSGITRLCNAGGGSNVYSILAHTAITDKLPTEQEVSQKYAMQFPLTVVPEGALLKQLQANPNVTYIKPITWMPILPIKSNVILSYETLDALNEGVKSLEQYSDERYIQEAQASFQLF